MKRRIIIQTMHGIWDRITRKWITVPAVLTDKEVVDNAEVCKMLNEKYISEQYDGGLPDSYRPRYQLLSQHKPVIGG